MDTRNEDNNIEFLDVLHCADKNAKGGFKTKHFVKPTGTNALFLNGKSHHPLHVFRGIILSEARRLRRLNEFDQDYQHSIEQLKKKCIKSKFPNNLVERNINTVLSWKRNLEKTQNKKNNQNIKRIPWVTEFHNILKINNLEKKLVPGASITYCRPPTLGNSLQNYRKISHNHTNDEDLVNKTRKCGKCGLCGNFGGLLNMVMDNNLIKTKDNKTIKIKQIMNCKDHGILVYMLDNVKYAKNIMLGRQKTNSTKDGMPIEPHGLKHESSKSKDNKSVKKTTIKLFLSITTNTIQENTPTLRRRIR